MSWQKAIEDGMQALLSGNLQIAEETFKAAMQEAKDSFAHTDPRIADSFSFLGQTYFLEKKDELALKNLQQAVKLGKAKTAQISIAEGLVALLKGATELEKENALGELKKHADPSLFTQIENRSKKQEQPIPNKKGKSSKSSPKGKKNEKPVEGGPAASPPPPKPKELEPINSNAAWSERLKTALQSAEKRLVDTLAAYQAIHDLIIERVNLLGKADDKVADALLALGQVAIQLQLYDRAEYFLRIAAKIYARECGENHLRTAYAVLNLADCFRERDAFDEAAHFFSAAANVLCSDETVDKVWFESIAQAFTFMEAKRSAEHFLFSKIDDIAPGSDAADAQFAEITDRIAECFPPDHPHFVLIYKRQSAALLRSGRQYESQVLLQIATYLEQKHNDRHAFSKNIDESFPVLPMNVLMAFA